MKKFVTPLVFIFTVYSTMAQWVSNGPWGGDIPAWCTDGSTVLTGTTTAGVFALISGSSGWAPFNNGLPALPYVLSLAHSDSGFLVCIAGKGVYIYPNGSNSWVPADSGLPASELTYIEVVNGSLVLAFVYGSGLYISENGGYSWTICNKDFSPGTLLSYGPCLIYANSNFLYFSTDTGKTFYTNMNLSPVGNIEAIAVDSNLIFVSSPYQGVFASADTGDTWQAVSGLPVGTNQPYVTSFAVNENIMYAAASDGSVYYSADYGQAWTQTGSVAGYGNPAIYGLLANGSVVYALTVYGVFVSVNYGITWSLPPGIAAQVIYTIAGNEGAIYTGGNEGGVFSSADGGNTWSPFNNGLTGADVLLLTTQGNRVYSVLNENGGVFMTTGNTWVNINANLASNLSYGAAAIVASESDLYVATAYPRGVYVNSTDVTWVADTADLPGTIDVFTTYGNTVYAGGDSGILYTTNGQGYWNRLPVNGIDSTVHTMVLNDSFIFAGNVNGLYYSADNGNDWSEATGNGLTNTQIHSLAYQYPVLLAGTAAGLFESLDNGRSWFENDSGITNKYITALSIVDGTVYAGTNGSGVWQMQLATSVQPVAPPSVMQISLSPNPATGTVQLQVSNDLLHSQWSLYDLTGQQISNGVIENSITGISTGNLAAGIYMVSVQGGAGIVTQGLPVNYKS